MATGKQCREILLSMSEAERRAICDQHYGGWENDQTDEWNIRHMIQCSVEEEDFSDLGDLLGLDSDQDQEIARQNAMIGAARWSAGAAWLSAACALLALVVSIIALVVAIRHK